MTDFRISTFLILFVSLFIWVGAAQALPMYGARSGRTCDNCHSLPNTWYDPQAVADRKCNLSCMACHVDPNGGGLPNVGGVYYAETTLPMFGGSKRPLNDQRSNLTDWLKQLTGAEAEATPSYQPTSGPTMAVATAVVDPRGPGRHRLTKARTLGAAPMARRLRWRG